MSETQQADWIPTLDGDHEWCVRTDDAGVTLLERWIEDDEGGRGDPKLVLIWERDGQPMQFKVDDEVYGMHDVAPFEAFFEAVRAARLK